MQDKATYHASATLYNEEVAIFVEGLIDRIEDPTVKQWCVSIAKQHRFHQARHQRALNRLKQDDVVDSTTEVVQVTEEVPAEKSIAEQQADFAEQQIAMETTAGSVEDRPMSDPEQCPEKAWHSPGSGVYDVEGHEIALGRWKAINETNTEA